MAITQNKLTTVFEKLINEDYKFTEIEFAIDSVKVDYSYEEVLDSLQNNFSMSHEKAEKLLKIVAELDLKQNEVKEIANDIIPTSNKEESLINNSKKTQSTDPKFIIAVILLLIAIGRIISGHGTFLNWFFVITVGLFYLIDFIFYRKK